MSSPGNFLWDLRRDQKHTEPRKGRRGKLKEILSISRFRTEGRKKNREEKVLGGRTDREWGKIPLSSQKYGRPVKTLVK